MKKKEKGVIANSFVLVLQLGLNIIIPILFCTMVAYMIGQKTENKSITIFGILLGIIAGVNGAVRQLKSYIKKDESPGQRARRLERENKNDN